MDGSGGSSADLTNYQLDVLTLYIPDAHLAWFRGLVEGNQFGIGDGSSASADPEVAFAHLDGNVGTLGIKQGIDWSDYSTRLVV